MINFRKNLFMLNLSEYNYFFFFWGYSSMVRIYVLHTYDRSSILLTSKCVHTLTSSFLLTAVDNFRLEGFLSISLIIFVLTHVVFSQLLNKSDATYKILKGKPR
jgi:hypothetical protein